MNDVYAIVARDDVAALASLVARERAPQEDTAREEPSPNDDDDDAESSSLIPSSSSVPSPAPLATSHHQCHDLIKQLPLVRQWALLLNMLNRFPASAVDHVSNSKTAQDWAVLQRAFVDPSPELTRRIVTYALTFQNQSVDIRNCHPFVVLFTDVLQSVQSDMNLVLSMLLRALGRPLGFLETIAEEIAPYWCTEVLPLEELSGIFADDAAGVPLDPAADCHPWAKQASVATIRRNSALYLCELASRGNAKAMMFIRAAAMFLPGTFLVEGLTHAARSTQQRMTNSNRRFTGGENSAEFFLADIEALQTSSSSPSQRVAADTTKFEEDTRRGSMCLLDAYLTLTARFSRAPGHPAPQQQQIMIPPFHLFLSLRKAGFTTSLALCIVTEWVLEHLPGMRHAVLFGNVVKLFEDDIMTSHLGHAVWTYGREALRYRR